jgi:hypothetical protein
MQMPSTKVCQAISNLVKRLVSTNERNAETAKRELTKILIKHHLTMNEIPAIIKSLEFEPLSFPSVVGKPKFNVLDELIKVINTYVYMSDPQFTMIAALWTLHCWIHDRYDITPRLALLSPVYGCGKTTLLILIEAFTPNSDRIDNCTPAALFRVLNNTTPPTVLLDEGDNLALLNPQLRAVLNSGHRKGAVIRRAYKEYRVFAPIAIAAVGNLPFALTQRSIEIPMQRKGPDIKLRKLKESRSEFVALRERLRPEIQRWANTCKLDPEPSNPVSNRNADNWEALLAIADNLGKGKEARQIALRLTPSDEDPRVILLADIKMIFEKLPMIDRISGHGLLAQLHEIPDGRWVDWAGQEGTNQAHKLTQNEMTRMLSRFRIHSHSVWVDNRSFKGYYKDDFKVAWAAYCTGKPATRQESKQKTKRSTHDNFLQ